VSRARQGAAVESDPASNLAGAPPRAADPHHHQQQSASGWQGVPAVRPSRTIHHRGLIHHQQIALSGISALRLNRRLRVELQQPVDGFGSSRCFAHPLGGPAVGAQSRMRRLLRPAMCARIALIRVSLPTPDSPPVITSTLRERPRLQPPPSGWRRAPGEAVCSTQGLAMAASMLPRRSTEVQGLEGFSADAALMRCARCAARWRVHQPEVSATTELASSRSRGASWINLGFHRHQEDRRRIPKTLQPFEPQMLRPGEAFCEAHQFAISPVAGSNAPRLDFPPPSSNGGL